MHCRWLSHQNNHLRSPLLFLHRSSSVLKIRNRTQSVPAPAMKKIKTEEERIETMASNASASGKKVSRVRTESKTKKHITIEYESATKTEPPKKWKEVWDHIVDMRKNRDAPVDSMGCEALPENTSPQIFRYQCLISLMLSSQTKDQYTAQAMKDLQKYGLTIPNILKIDTKELDKLIKCVGFHNKKAEYIKKTTQILHEKFNDDTPQTLEELLELPGVGPKMGHLFLQIGLGQTTGIGVDVHVHRISDRLGWTKKAKTPEDSREQLEKWLPKDYWRDINLLFVGFGQQICTPVATKCDQCELRNGLCPSAYKFASKADRAEHQAEKRKKSRQRKKKTVEKEEEGESEGSGSEED